MGDASTDRGVRAYLAWGLRVLLASAFALLLSYLPYRIVAQPGEHKLQDMQAELLRVRSEIAHRQVEVGERRLRVQALKTDTRTIENIARHDLQMLYPHEKTLRLSIASAEAK